jgi:hypothetical protein
MQGKDNPQIFRKMRMPLPLCDRHHEREAIAKAERHQAADQ